MHNPQFKILAVRVTSEDSIGKRKLKLNEFYYPYQGYTIVGDNITVEKSSTSPIELYNEYLNNDDGTASNIVVSISAIVGENGSGKSSIIEFSLRLINNFAASTIGEYEVNPRANRLHYIENMYGELYYTISGDYYRLKVQGRSVVLTKYATIDKKEHGSYKLLNTNIFNNEIKESTDKIKPFIGFDKDVLSKYYKHFFYTFVSNYSIYAYNTNDFKSECNSQDYEKDVRGGRKSKYSVDERCWLNGIFHKNDGYQTPIVLTPFREEGNIDINTENTLAKNRLISAMMMPNSQFRIINGHLLIESITIKNNNRIYNAKQLKERVGFERLHQRGYENFETKIIKLWSKFLGVDLTTFQDDRSLYKEAIGYITYKTLKISSNYSQYHYFFKKHKDINFKINEEQLSLLVSKLVEDPSHITKKIRQTLAYIIFGTYDTPNEEIVEINDFVKKARTAFENGSINSRHNTSKNDFSWEIDDFVPSPIFNTTIDLIDIKVNSAVIFETLSSGEKQQAYSISSLLYHLGNLNSVVKDKNKNRIAHRNINIVLEEIELYFHPDLQRTFVKYILDGIKQIELPNIDALNICFVTHSPFILSDIPSQNILLLNKKAEPSKNNIKTFGANIHDMLKDSFFLTEGSIGKYAQWLINRIVIIMEITKSYTKGHEVDLKDLHIPEHLNNDNYAFTRKFIVDTKFKISSFKEKYDTNYIYNMIKLLDEPIIRNALLTEYYNVFKNDSRINKIIDLKKQLKDLEEEI